MTLVGYNGFGPPNLRADFDESPRPTDDQRSQPQGREESYEPSPNGRLGRDTRKAIEAAVQGREYGCRTVSERPQERRISDYRTPIIDLS